MKTIEDIILPVIHSNGTSAETLIEDLCLVHGCLIDALDALKRAAPNGRDYYPDPGRMEKAEQQHWQRMQTLADLMDEIQLEIEAIDSIARN